MILLDFLFYYLSLYFTKRTQSVTWSTPKQRAAYALGLISTSWLMSIHVTLYVLNIINYNISYIYVIASLLLIWLYNYVYITKERYEGIDPPSINDGLGIGIAWFILLFSFSLPFAILILNMK
jgi:hypothetical protein